MPHKRHTLDIFVGGGSVKVDNLGMIGIVVIDVEIRKRQHLENVSILLRLVHLAHLFPKAAKTLEEFGGGNCFHFVNLSDKALRQLDGKGCHRYDGNDDDGAADQVKNAGLGHRVILRFDALNIAIHLGGVKKIMRPFCP